MRRLAIVSCLPPEQTGVADFTERLLPVAGDIVHAYAIPSVRRRYIAANPFDLSRWKVRPLHRLQRDAGRDVDAVAVMLGNSAHFAPIIDWAHRWRSRPPAVPLLLCLHDVFLLNVLGHLRSGNALMEDVALDQGRAVQHPADFGDVAGLAEARTLGAAVIIRHLQPDAVLVNSLAAQSLLAQEPGLPRDVRIVATFLPVFSAPIRWQRNMAEHPLRIGTFGLPTPLKQVDLVVDAFAALQEEEPDATLVIAGYGARQFAKASGLNSRRGIEVYDAPSDATLDALMASVDLGVQLRAVDLGESSGVVARLLALGTPTLVSARGAMLELGGAVAFASATVTASELANLIRREVAQATDRREQVRRYVDGHGARECVQHMVQVARDLRNRAGTASG